MIATVCYFSFKSLFVIIADTDPAASTEDIFDVQSCRSKLAEHYKRTAIVPTSVWSKTSIVDIHQIYTRLSWVKEEQTPAGSSRYELEHYTDVFTANKNGILPKRILVQGQAGIGKSTFVKKLAVDWAELDHEITGHERKDAMKSFQDDEDKRETEQDDEASSSEDGGEDTSSDEYEDTSSDENEDTSSDEYDDTSFDECEDTSSDECEDTSSDEKYISEDMSESQKDALKKFQLVLVVNLKEVSKCQSFQDVISQSSIFSEEETALTEGILRYITKNQDKVLLVFDGYDEYRCGSNSEIYEIFRGKKLRNCCVLITTRISKADELRTFKDMHAEITGFCEEDIKAFMRRMLGGEAEARELSRHLDWQYLEDLAKVPLLLLFFCTLWKKGKSKSFPESKTKLYLAIVQYVLDYNQGKDSPTYFGKVHDFEDVLAEIGKVALECLLKDDHVFEYDQLSAAVRCDGSQIIGLLQVTEYAENLRPAGMVSFIHKSIQEFLAAWFISYRCVPEGNLGGIEQHTRTLENCKAWENVFQFVCGLSDDGAGNVFQHLASVRISDPTLDLSKTIPDVGSETDEPLCDVTYRHEKFSALVDDSLKEVQSKGALARYWLDCKAGIILISLARPFSEHIPKMRIVNEDSSCKALFLHDAPFYRLRRNGYREWMSRLCEVLEFFDCSNDLLRITENSAALLIEDFLTQFKTVGCAKCRFDCVVRVHNGKAQFYVTGLWLRCDDHARLFTETITISTPSCSESSCSKQSCLKFLRSLYCNGIVNAQTLKDLGAVVRNCKHLKTIEFRKCRDGMCELLEQVPNPCTCCVNIGSLLSQCSLTSVEAEKLAGVLPRFINITALYLRLRDCCAAAVNKLVSSISRKTLKKLSLHNISLTPAAAAPLGRSLPEMSSLETLELTGADGSILQEEEMEALFGGMNGTFPALQWLDLKNFNARGSLAPLTKRVQFFPNLTRLVLWSLNMDERDLHCLLESLRSISNLKDLNLTWNPLGSRDEVRSVVQQALPQVRLSY